MGKLSLLSFEVFPPKKEILDLSSIYQTIDGLLKYKPKFISVTYGAGGSTNKNTLSVASYIRQKGLNPLAHLTCASESLESINAFCENLLINDVNQILALRGDAYLENEDHIFKHASDLMKYISTNYPIKVVGACYPEKHIESSSIEDDIEAYRIKQESGAQFLISQLFFDNNDFYQMLRLARQEGVYIPIIAGIMPIVNTHQFERITKLTSVNIPNTLRTKLALCSNSDEMFDVGIDFAVDQIIDLLKNNVDGVHLYIMNQTRVADAIYQKIKNHL